MAKRMTVELGDECEVEVDKLHETLLKLPAEKYLELYKRMYAKIYRYPAILELENTNFAKTIESGQTE